MNFDVAKRNRLNGKFNFKLRDWQFELDGIEDHPPIPLKNGRPRKPKLVWERDWREHDDPRYDEADVG